MGKWVYFQQLRPWCSSKLNRRNSFPVKILKFYQKEQMDFTNQENMKMPPSAEFYTLKYFDSLLMKGSAI